MQRAIRILVAVGALVSVVGIGLALTADAPAQAGLGFWLTVGGAALAGIACGCRFLALRAARPSTVWSDVATDAVLATVIGTFGGIVVGVLAVLSVGDVGAGLIVLPAALVGWWLPFLVAFGVTAGICTLVARRRRAAGHPPDA